MKLFKSVVLLSVLLQINLVAQIHSEKFCTDTCKADLFHNLKYDFNSFVNVGIDYFESPFHFDGKDFLIAGLIVGGTVLSFTLDNPVKDGINKTHSNTIDDVTGFAKNFGEPVYGSALAGLLYAGGHIYGSKYIRETGLMLFEAMLLNGIVTGTLKTVFGRSRPYTGKGNTGFHLFNFDFDNKYQSLPSGHTSTAFTIVTVLSERINNIYVSILLYSFAGMTAYERIYDDKHWFSDTVLGAAIGTVTGLAVVKLYSKVNLDKDNCVQLNVLPSIGRKDYGFILSLNF